jgi:glucosamine--fructose-6-phosphate aminotransferase (isomerizing)
MKHGFIALMDENLPTVSLCTQDSVYEKQFSNMEEIKARKGKILAIANQGDDRVKSLSDDVIYVPLVNELLAPIVNLVPLQLFAYYISVLRGLDVDQPRNLAKSVTVE